MKFNLPLVVLISLVLLVWGCGPAAEEPAAEAPSQAEDVAAINAIADANETAVNTSDAAAIAALFTEDAISMPPNRPASVGKEAVQSYYQSVLDEYAVQLTLNPEEIEVVGDWAFVRGPYTEAVTPKAGGDSVEDNGKYLFIAKRQLDSSWKIYREIWNSNNPATGTGK